MRINTKNSVALHCVIFIAEYENTNKVTGELLSKSTGCNPVIVRRLLTALQKAGIVAVRRGSGGAHLCRPAGEITVWDIFHAADPDCLSNFIACHSNTSDACPVGCGIPGIIGKLRENVGAAMQREMESITLQQILDEYHDERRRAAVGGAS